MDFHIALDADRRLIGENEMKFIYPNIELYMINNELSLREFAKRCGIQTSTMSRILNGKVDVQKSNIDKILAETGMSYEVCFKEHS